MLGIKGLLGCKILSTYYVKQNIILPNLGEVCQLFIPSMYARYFLSYVGEDIPSVLDIHVYNITIIKKV